MKTVGDFKDAGLVFVKGDLVDGVTGNEHSPDCDPFNCFSDQRRFREAWTIRSFAWRTNTGVRTKFIGEIEYKTISGGYHVGSANFAFESTRCGDFVITKWRPHLPKVDKPKSPYDVDAHVSGNDFASSLKRQFEPKPIFTQAMSDAGELPIVGSYAEIAESTKYLSIRYEAGCKVKVYATFTDYRGVKLAAFVGDNGKVGGVAVAECFKPIQTERDRVTDKAALLIASKEVLHNQYPRALAIAEILYDAGLLK